MRARVTDSPACPSFRSSLYAIMPNGLDSRSFDDRHALDAAGQSVDEAGHTRPGSFRRDSALARFESRYRRPITRYAESKGLDPDTAGDVYQAIQSAFIAATHGIRFDRKSGRFFERFQSEVTAATAAKEHFQEIEQSTIEWFKSTFRKKVRRMILQHNAALEPDGVGEAVSDIGDEAPDISFGDILYKMARAHARRIREHRAYFNQLTIPSADSDESMEKDIQDPNSVRPDEFAADANDSAWRNCLFSEALHQLHSRARSPHRKLALELFEEAIQLECFRDRNERNADQSVENKRLGLIERYFESSRKNRVGKNPRIAEVPEAAPNDKRGAFDTAMSRIKSDIVALVKELDQGRVLGTSNDIGSEEKEG